MGDNDVSVILVGIGSAVLVLTIYHCLAMGWCHPHRDSQGQGAAQAQDQQNSLQHEMIEIASSENSIAQLIPARKYRNGMGSGTGLVDDNGMCAVCLCQFEEGEELKTLPECLHSYHTPCIDMWLYSHSSCPMCRTDATPSPQIFRHQSDFGTAPPDSGSLQLDSGPGRTSSVEAISTVRSSLDLLARSLKTHSQWFKLRHSVPPILVNISENQQW
ncbi:hypothetical protein DITRI_Ditri09bG0128400 [Diplodiscus trichospermus]